MSKIYTSTKGNYIIKDGKRQYIGENGTQAKKLVSNRKLIHPRDGGWELPDFLMTTYIGFNLGYKEQEELAVYLGLNNWNICRMLPRAMRVNNQNCKEYIVAFSTTGSKCSPNKHCVCCTDYGKEIVVTLFDFKEIQSKSKYSTVKGYEFKGIINGTNISFEGNYYNEQNYENSIAGIVGNLR